MWFEVLGGLVVAFVVFSFLLLRRQLNACRRTDLPSQVPPGNKKSTTPNKVEFDVAIVGAGPSGATTAFYLKKSNPKLKVLLLDRATFPRKKYCGDAWLGSSLSVLEDMGILQQLETGIVTLPGIDISKYEGFSAGKPLCWKTQRGGFISPSGEECINREASVLGDATGVRSYAIKRFVVDEFVARRAALEGADLREGVEIKDAEHNSAGEGSWTIRTENSQFTARMLVIADGSTSQLGQKLGLVQGQSDAVCSHQYAQNGTHGGVDADGVMHFHNSLLPGYSAVFRHANGDVYLGTYILPGGHATSRWIKPFEDEMMKRYPPVSKTFSAPNIQYREGRKIAPIRIWPGGVSKSYGNNVILVGDAAGMVDPLTGEGIHTAMQGGRIAATSLLEMFDKNNFSETATSVYHRRWCEAMAEDFLWSWVLARVLRVCPLFLDAMAVVGRRRGQKFLDEFGEVMTGVKSKASLFHPRHSLPIAVEIVRQVIGRVVFGWRPRFPDCGSDLIAKYAK